ncbi:MAG: DMT family transporter [Terracidiphilus sp.]
MAGSASAGLGLCSAAFWGGSDFAGGWGSRRAPALLIVTSGQIVSGAFLVILCFALDKPSPAAHYSLLAIVGGFEGALSLVIFYRALAIGAMGLTAALTGLLTALIPVLFSLLREGLPAPVNLAGLATGCMAIWFITHQAPASQAPTSQVAESQVDESQVDESMTNHTPGAGGNALLLGTLSGIGFGCQLVLLKMASNGGVLWSLTWTRISGVSALLLALTVLRPKAPVKAFFAIGIVAGILDTLGNMFYVFAAQTGRLDIAALVSSLYPAGTILLAAILLRERPSRRQMAGIGLALAAVVMLSV